VDLSIVMCGRNDNHGGSYTNRVSYALKRNGSIFSKGSLSFETLFVEWSPADVRFHEQTSMTAIFDSLNTKHIVVERSVPQKDGLNPEIFYEYFAKNVGIRGASGDYVLLLNTDCYLSEELYQLSEAFIKGKCSGVFCRPSNRISVELSTGKVVSTFNLSATVGIDANVCGAYSGDFLLVKKADFINSGKGYDEVNPTHRRNRQTSMDGEILHNLHHDGVFLK